MFDSRQFKLVKAIRSIRSMKYIKILSPQTCVIFQQYLTISDSRPIKLVKATRVIRDIEPPNIHSSLYDLLAMPNHL